MGRKRGFVSGEQPARADVDAIIGDCRTHSDEEFLFIPGIEMGCFTTYFLGTGPALVVPYV
jgi:hypothetical protein